MFVGNIFLKFNCMPTKLKKDFYKRKVLEVAEELLGKIFVVNDKSTGKLLKGRIVEVEAYDGRTDEAAHTFRGKTDRNRIMFEEGGYLYIYFTYGIHYCANIVADKKNIGTAVLLRAMEPINGIDIFSQRRFNTTEIDDKMKMNLLNGPAKICQAFGLDKQNNGTDLLGKDIYILDRPKLKETEIIRGKRIGITRSVDLPWRFFIDNNPFVSGFKVNKKGRK